MSGSAPVTSACGRRRPVQQRIRDLVRASGMRLVGPNCMGVLNTDPAVRMHATFAPIQPQPGNVGFLSQSGALGLAVLDYAHELNIGLSSFVSVGNKADVSGNDLLSFWREDPRTDVVALYLESFGNPRKFARLAPAVGKRKPIVAVEADPAVDAVVVIYVPPLAVDSDEVTAAIARGAAQVPATKPVASVFLSSKGAPPALARGPRGRLPSYSFPENAARALAAAVKY